MAAELALSELEEPQGLLLENHCMTRPGVTLRRWAPRQARRREPARHFLYGPPEHPTLRLPKGQRWPLLGVRDRSYHADPATLPRVTFVTFVPQGPQ
ncbi:hypothetical protein [Mumia zhuanghuii]|uniref:Uncharacterized protein n=1 Tax=Mumia zhuanghuii TaxID=2585211 RepID=A0A5C4MCF3_9ACTN|nr:hypothetical protein [Mumia zhuanghuii]TNC36452.1 hypothetical protein FHE65_26235 [Mumia zhuanghuii]